MTRPAALAFLAMMAALSTCRPSPAGMYMKSDSFSTVAVPFSGETLLTLPQFDSSYGTLTDVSFSLTASIVASGNLTFVTPTGTPCTFTETSTGYSIAAAAGAPSPLAGVSFNPLVTNNRTLIGSKTETSTGTYGINFIDAPAAYTAADYNLTTNPTNLDAFVGTGTYGFVVSAFVSEAFSNNNSFIVTDYTFAAASMTVTYTYTPTAVPEPSSLALVGIAASLVGGRLTWARFRNRSRTVRS